MHSVILIGNFFRIHSHGKIYLHIRVKFIQVNVEYLLLFLFLIMHPVLISLVNPSVPSFPSFPLVISLVMTK